MHRFAVLQVVLCVVCGCGGGYVMTAGDQLAPAGGEAATVIRLQQSELPLIAPAARDVAVRFFVGDGPQRAARTDRSGYAAVAVPVPPAAGTYEMTVALQDTQGDEASWPVRTFVWDAQQPVVAVELDAIPDEGQAMSDARAALASLARRANIVYLTSESLGDLDECRQFIQAAKLPDGPVLAWRKKPWPRRGIISPLPALRETFSRLETGVGRGKLAMSAYQAAGMKAVAIGKGGEAWAQLAEIKP